MTPNEDREENERYEKYHNEVERIRREEERVDRDSLIYGEEKNQAYVRIQNGESYNDVKRR
jgi:hypothetical protein